MAEEKERPGKPKKDDETVQINRSLGYLISIAASPDSLFGALRKAEPLLNKKLLKRLAATIHVINKVKNGKAENEAPQGEKF